MFLSRCPCQRLGSLPNRVSDLCRSGMSWNYAMLDVLHDLSRLPGRILVRVGRMACMRRSNELSTLH